ncbi:MAG: fibronectin type III domain-containing protein, partial [Acidimicrobiales bacterium]
MTTRGIHRRTSSRRHWLLARTTLVAAGFVLAASGAAWGYFSASSGGYGVAAAGAVAEPASFSATATSATQVTLSWSAPSPPPPETYSYTLTGTLGTGTGTCTATMASAVTTCTVTGLAPSTPYMWSLEVVYESWSGPKTDAGATTQVLTPSFVGVGAIQTWTTSATETVAYPSGVAATDL